MNKLKILLPVALCVIGAMAIIAAESARDKAKYYYTEGALREASGDNAAAYALYKKAYDADSTYVEAASAYGTHRLSITTDTMQSPEELKRSLRMMRRYVDAYPEDLYESVYYGFIAGQLDTLPEAVRVLERAYQFHPEATSVLLQLSDAYARNNELRKSIESISRYEKQEGLDPQITTRKMAYLLADHDTVGALTEVTRLIESSPSTSSYKILKGNLFEILNKPDSVEYYFQMAEREDPESSVAKLALANHYRQRGDSVAYDEKMYEVLLTEDLELDGKVSLVGQYLQNLMSGKQSTERGDYLFSVLRDQYPHDARVLDLAARYSAAKRDFIDAEEQISYALDQDPSNTVYWGQLMTYQAADGHPEQSMETYKKALKHTAPDENLRLYYASVSQMAKRYDEALKVYRDEIAAIDSNLNIDTELTLNDVRPTISLDELDRLSNYLTIMGDIYHLSGDQDKAYQAYRNAILFDDGNNMARNNYAYFLAENGGNLKEALELSGKAISGKDSSNPTYLDTYAWINFKMGDIATAEKYQLIAVDAMEKEDYKSAEVYDHLGDILLKSGKDEDALNAWNKAVEIQQEYNDTDEPSYKVTLEKIHQLEKKLKNSK